MTSSLPSTACSQDARWYRDGARRCIGSDTLTVSPTLATVGAMALLSEESVKTRRWSRVEYDRLAEYWIVNIVDHALEVYREPERETDEREDWTYRSVESLRPPATVTPLAAPHARIAVADLLP